MMASALPCIILVTLAWTGYATVQGPDGCVIPDGMYNDYPADPYDPEPTAGRRCLVNLTTPTQRMAYQCMSRWCCNNSCTCDSSDIVESYIQSCKMMSCYVKRLIMECYYKFDCCPGYHQINETCVPQDLCLNNSLGCQYQCSTFNGSSTCTCPEGYQLNPADHRTCRDIDECQLSPSLCDDICTNLDGSYRCSCGVGKQLAPDERTCVAISTPTSPTTSTTPIASTSTKQAVIVFASSPNLVVDSTVFASSPIPVMDSTTRKDDSAFPYQYIIAAVVASAILLLLLLLVILCCVCRRRKHTPIEVYYVGKEDEIKKKADIDPYDTIAISFDEGEKKNVDYETIKDVLDGKLEVSGSGNSNAAPAAGRGLLERGVRAQPNVYSSLSAGKPAARQVVLPTVSDLDSDYAEIIDAPPSSVA